MLQTSIFNNLRTLRPYLSKLPLRRIIPRAGKWYDDFTSKFCDAGQIVEIQGSKMFLDMAHPDTELRAAFQSYAFNRIHEPTTTALFEEIVREGDTVLDLGANIGYFSLLAAKLVGSSGQVHSFEPEPRNFAYLQKNIELNSYSNITANNAAVSYQSGIEKLFLCPYDSGHHTLKQPGGIIETSHGRMKSGAEQSIEVRTVVVDEYFEGKKQKPDIIKMDIEGAEVLAVTGMKKILAEKKDLGVFLEYYPLLLKQMGSKPEELLELLLLSCGFRVAAVSGDYSLEDSASEQKLIPLSGIEEIVSLCTGKEDHANLFLYKGERFSTLFD